jgi:hypothetical protein
MSTALDGATVALDLAARASAAALRAALLDVDDPRHGPGAVRAVLAHAEVLSSAVTRLARHVERHPAPAPPKVRKIDIFALTGALAAAWGQAERCPSCEGWQAPEKPLDWPLVGLLEDDEGSPAPDALPGS